MPRNLCDQNSKIRAEWKLVPHATICMLVMLFTAVNNITNIQIVACGTSFHSARIFEFWSHKFLGINCRVDYGSEYQYQEPVKTDKTLLITISQSGETAVSPD